MSISVDSCSLFSLVQFELSSSCTNIWCVINSNSYLAVSSIIESVISVKLGYGGVN